MSLQNWLVRESLRRRLAVLAETLSELVADCEAVKLASSKTVAARVQTATEDYWAAVKAFGDDDFEAAGQATTASAIQVDFARKLMRTETAERELGHGRLFELGTTLTEAQQIELLKTNLKQITFELSNVFDAVKGRSL